MSENSENRLGIILFNLGGPDKLTSVRPFLYNLFSDPVIIQLISPLRRTIAYFLAKFRAPLAEANYSLMGGSSPLLAETIKQQHALNQKLMDQGLENFKIFVSMRYWHPLSDEIIKQMMEFKANRLVLLPLYPHFSITTSGSSIADFTKKLKKLNFEGLVKTVCCYPLEQNFIKAHVNSIKKALIGLPNKKKLRILFSAHSLPKKIIKKGDPYQWQIEQTVEKILQDDVIAKYDCKICYQSKIGPIEWLSPSTEQEVHIAAKSNIDLLLVPIAFVSEHIETLVELDIEYRDIAKKYGINYHRVPTLGTNDSFIECLSEAVNQALSDSNSITNFSSSACLRRFKNCICKNDC